MILSALLRVAAATLAPVAARADFHVRSPDDINEGEWELESNGSASFDRNPFKGNDTSYTAEIGRGVNSWYHTELELDFGRLPAPGTHTRYQGLTWENTVRLTEPGEYWADIGLYAEYTHAASAGVADDVLFGPLVQKDIGRTTHTLNLFVAQEIGPNQDGKGLDFSYAWQSRWNLVRQASPAIEIYGDAGGIGRLTGLRHQQLLAGPVLVGSFLLGPLGDLKYQAGYLFGATAATAHGMVKWGLEWEEHF